MTPDLPELQRVAVEMDLSWRPGPTVNSDFSRLQAVARLGAMPPGGKRSLAQKRRAAARQPEVARAESAIASATPGAWDWRDHAGGNYVSAVKDQGGCGSCVAFGTTAVLESMVRIAAKQPKLRVNLSEAQAFFCYGPRNGAGACPAGGWWPDDSFEACRKGLVDEACYRYTDDDQKCDLGADWKSRLTKYASWTKRTTRTSMKAYLATVGPMSACFTIYEDFFSYYAGGIYTYHEKTSGDVIGGHCVAIVGFDDAQRCWIAKNSWGTGWGEDGFFRIAYGSAGIDAEMWGIDGKITSPLIRTGFRTVAANGGDLWGASRRSSSGTWIGMSAIDKAPVPDPGRFTKVSTAATINTLHAVGLVGGVPWHASHRAGTPWSSFAKPTSKLPSGVRTFSRLTSAAVGDTLHVVAVGKGSLWHTSRSGSGTWKSTWTRVVAERFDPAAFSAVSAATVGSRLHVVAVANGGLAHTVLNTDGTWPQRTTQITTTTPDGAAVLTLGTAGVESDLYLVVLVGGRLHYAVRPTAGAWPAAFTAVPTTGVATFQAVSAVDVGPKLHLLGLAGKKLWHTYRQPDGTWGTTFTDVASKLAAVPSSDFVAVDCA